MSDYGLSSWMQDALRAPVPLLEPGTDIGRRYRVDCHLGSGAFGTVYAAVDRKLNRRVALKLMAPSRLRGLGEAERHDYVKTFAHEARVTAQLPHPNIVVVHDVKTAKAICRSGGQSDTTWRGTPFFVMELLEGETLYRRLQRGALSVDEALVALDGLCQGVAFAHDSGVVHRDLKPANVYVCADGRLKVLDFGIAMADALARKDTPDVSELGTRGYMAPERLSGAQQDQRVDVYALGVIAYEMLSGERPPADQHQRPRLRARVYEVPPALDDLVERCLAMEPADRPPSVSTILAEVRRIATAYGGPAGGHIRVGTPDDREPFPGLAAFREEQALFFFGRGREIRDLIARMGPSRRWLAVEGASGVGKSSLVQAGLLPAIRCGWVAGAPKRWRTAVLRPGPDPATALRNALAVPTGDPIQAAACSLGADEALVVVVDQFEEVMRSSEDASAQLLDRWLAEALALDAPVYLVTTMRSDFAQQLGHLPHLGPLVNDVASRYQLRPLVGAALRQAIAGPAALTGSRWAPEVLDRIIADAADAPGSLPLVSHALRTMWLDAAGGAVTIEDYERIGGLGGALARTATTALDGLNDDGRQRARTLLLALIVSGRELPDVRRTITYARALEAAGGGSNAQGVLSRLADARLIVVANDHVDLVHEALLRTWPELRRWVDESRRELERRDELNHAALAWHMAQRPDDGLPRGGQLAYFLTAPAENETAQSFLQAATLAEDLRRTEATRTFRRRIFVLSLALVLALGLATWAMFERAEADAQRRIAEQRRTEAKAVADRLVHDLDDELARIPGTSRARGALLDTAGDLLDRLNGNDGASLEVIASRVGSHRKRARLASRYEAHELAVRELLEAERLGRRRVALDPSSREAKLELARTLRELHWQDRSALNFQSARLRNADARALVLPLVEVQPDHAESRRVLVDLFGDQQSLAEGIGPLAEAGVATAQYERYLKPLLQTTPVRPEDLNRAVRMYVGRAALASKMGDSDTAFQELGQARVTNDRAGPFSDPVEMYDRQTWLDLRDGQFALAANRFDRAERSLSRTVNGLQLMLQRQPGTRATQLRLVVARCCWAQVLLHAGDVSASEIQLALALDTMDAQLKLDAGNPRFSYYFGQVQLGRARLALARHAPFEAAMEAALAVQSFRTRWQSSYDIENAVHLVDALLALAAADAMTADEPAVQKTLNEVNLIIDRYQEWSAIERGRRLSRRALEIAKESLMSAEARATPQQR